mgnify:CR=1 FL=1
MTNAQDPRYTKYFKMLKNGVPLAAVQQKMMFEGFSPDVLSNPDGPSDFKGNCWKYIVYNTIRDLIAIFFLPLIEEENAQDDEENDWSDDE